jgi:ribonuclease/clavin/mitogillin
MSVIKIRYKSTNCYFIDTGKGLLAFDAGWPNTYRDYKDRLKEQGHSVKNIRWLMVSHFHIDHAGLAGILVENGVRFIVFPNQLGAIDEMEALIERKNMVYRKIDRSKIKVLEIGASRRWLEAIGIPGEVLHTNGHGEQSISLLLDTGEALIGDLAPEGMIADEDCKSKNSWALLRSKGAKYIKPAHAKEFVLTG